MKNIITLSWLLLIVLISACNKEDSEEIKGDPTGLLYQVNFNSELHYEYKYNVLNQIAEEKSRLHYTKHNYKNGILVSSDYYYDPGMYSSNSYLVDSALNREDWVNPTNTEKSSTKTYFHDNEGRIIKTSNYIGDCEYTYDDRNRIICQTFISEDEETGYIDFVYDDNDNMVEKLHYWILDSGEPELQTTTEYEFDTKKNPYKSFNSLMMPGEYTNTNNIVKETYTLYFEVNQYSGVDSIQITENTYEYNSEGFPISKNDNETYIYY